MLISFKSNNFNLKPILLILKQTIKISLRIKIQNAFLTSQIKSQMFRKYCSQHSLKNKKSYINLSKLIQDFKSPRGGGINPTNPLDQSFIIYNKQNQCLRVQLQLTLKRAYLNLFNPHLNRQWNTYYTLLVAISNFDPFHGRPDLPHSSVLVTLLPQGKCINENLNFQQIVRQLPSFYLIVVLLTTNPQTTADHSLYTMFISQSLQLQ